MRRAIALLGLFGIVGAGVSLSVLPTTRTVAASSEQRTFLIPASDGYGVADCISSKSECGTIVANAYCEAQGFAKATAYGLATREDFTGALSKATPVAEVETPLVITCGRLRPTLNLSFDAGPGHRPSGCSASASDGLFHPA